MSHRSHGHDNAFCRRFRRSMDRWRRSLLGAAGLRAFRQVVDMSKKIERVGREKVRAGFREGSQSYCLLNSISNRRTAAAARAETEAHTVRKGRIELFVHSPM
jgi:hypothetical protein